MRVLLTGSRTWKKRGPVEALMLGMRDATFILGDNPSGLDAIAKKVAEDNKLSHIVKIADWDKFGDGAGPKRNGDMVAEKPNVAFAFKQQAESVGTEDCMRKCVHAGVPVYLMTPIDIDSPGMFKIPGTKGYRYNSAFDNTWVV